MWVYKEIRTLGDYVSYYGHQAGDRPALVYAGHITSYRELDLQTARLAQGLLAAGLRTHGLRELEALKAAAQVDVDHDAGGASR
mgnify:CR=1 FL=1